MSVICVCICVCICIWFWFVSRCQLYCFRCTLVCLCVCVCVCLCVCVCCLSHHNAAVRLWQGFSSVALLPIDLATVAATTRAITNYCICGTLYILIYYCCVCACVCVCVLQFWNNFNWSNCENHLFTIISYSLQVFDCKNHVRVIQSMQQGDRLYVCGTNAHNPKDYVIYVSIQQLHSFMCVYPGSRTSFCSSDNATTQLFKRYEISKEARFVCLLTLDRNPGTVL